MTNEELQARIAALEASNAKLREAATKAANRKLTFKVGEKGGASVSGLGRFPTTLYYGQWKRFLAVVDDFEIWLEEQKEMGNLTLRPEEE